MSPTLTSKLWTEVTTSEHAHERAALHFIRERFPPREPFRAWANFTFIADDGTRNEVDLLVVSPTGVYLIEIKSHPGRMDGDAGTWVWTSPEARRRTFDNPLLLAERKAKKLKSLLMRQRPLRNRHRDGFYLRSVIFLSDPSLTIGLNQPGRTDVFGPDREVGSEGEPNDLPGLIKLLTRVNPHRGRQVDRPLSSAIAEAMDSAGIRESTTHRKVGIYELGELIDEGEGWQDFAAVHPEVSDTHRRIRQYLTGRSVDEEERDALTRAAEREFRFLELINEPAIDTPLELLHGPKGPALVFRRDPDAMRLDHWLADRGDDLDLSDRIELVRDLAESLRRAHRHGLYHRALSPRSVSVVERAGKVTLRIQDWQTATRQRSTELADPTGTAHVGARVSEKARIFLAPETLAVPDALPEPADIWSLGAVSALILSGRSPAPDLDGLHELLLGNGCLTLATSMDAPPVELDRIIRTATAAEASERFVSVDEFLEFLDLALEELTAPDERDPLEASRGDLIGDRWKVLRRVGKSRISVVLLTKTEEREEVLKIARSEEFSEVLEGEFEILSQLRDATIIQPYGLEQISGRTILRLEPALGTLGDQLRKDGPLSLDLLERFGTDLLKAATFLDNEGVAHRDIKPDNIGIAERGQYKERHLVLLDFSVSRTDPAETRVGTVGYIDPFLEERDPKRWDSQAERYSIGVTLYEMATGSRPTWGDGSTDPLLTDQQTPTIETDLIDASVRESLESFFLTALHRRPEERFDTAGEMLRVWSASFAHSEPSASGSVEISAADLDLSEVLEETPLLALGLPPKVRNALDRLGTVTVADLAAVPPAQLVRLGGIGATTRREVNHLAKRLREELDGMGAPTGSEAGSIDAIASQLIPGSRVDEDHRTAMSAMLELGDDSLATWPTHREVGEVTGLGREIVGEALAVHRERWRRRADLTAVRREIAELLSRRGGVVGGGELAGVLLASRGSLASEPLRSRRARAVVRAAAETEAAMKEPRFLVRRLGGAIVVVLDGRVVTEDGEAVVWDAEALAAAAASLGEVAEDLASREPLVSAKLALRDLRAVDLPAGVGPFSDARIVRLAAAACEGVSVSTRLEFYPRGMVPLRAVGESRALLLDRNGLTPTEVRDRVSARFPEAAKLPDRPSLDALLKPHGLVWKEDLYQLPTRGGVLSTYLSSGTITSVFSTAEDRNAAAREVDHRLDTVRAQGGFLALTVGRRRYGGAADIVARRLGAGRADVDALLLDGMHRQSDELGATWDAFLDADNRRGEQKWTKLGQLLDRVIPGVERTILEMNGVMVLTGFGLLARYERSALLGRLRDTMRTHAGEAGLQGVVLIVPGDDPKARPIVDGMPIPVITANQWGHIPNSWLIQNSEGEAA